MEASENVEKVENVEKRGKKFHSSPAPPLTLNLTALRSSD
jgi:hypothetical protein